MMAFLVATCSVIAALAGVILVLGMMVQHLRLLARRYVPASGGARWSTDELVCRRSDASLGQRRGAGQAGRRRPRRRAKGGPDPALR